ncbi:MAG: alkaline phosphatase family protein [Bacillota bacterium]
MKKGMATIGTVLCSIIIVVLALTLVSTTWANSEKPGADSAAGQDALGQNALAKYVIYINWDACAYRYYEWANSPGQPGTPNLNYLASRGALFTNARNGIPGITNPMQTSIVTGTWPAVHGNTYRYYDPVENLVKETGRHNDAETIAEVVEKSGLPCASVQQFMLQERGTYTDDPYHLYIQPGAGWLKRVAEAEKILNLKPVFGMNGKMITPAERPTFMAIYADDLDAAGHNASPGYGFSVARDYDSWKAKMTKVMIDMDEGLGNLIDALKKLGIFEETAIILTADHGMTPYWGPSSLQDLIKTVESLGYKCEFLGKNERASKNTDIVLVSAGLSVQFYFRNAISDAQYKALIDTLASKPYVGGYFTADDLKKEGAHPSLGSLMIWPEPPNHFHTSGKLIGLGGQHDSGEESSRHVFMLISGAGVKQGVVIDSPVQIIDAAPTMSRLMGLRQPANATGRVLYEALVVDE